MKDVNEERALVQSAVAGSQQALETLLCSVQDMVFNLALRMLGSVPDAEDATQEILIKVMTHLSSFRQESSLKTWVFRIAVNDLRSYKKGMFAHVPFSFEMYGADIVSGKEKDVPDLTGGVDTAILEEELKYSCTNVMLQCLDAQSRCIYILGTMFRLHSGVAAEILGITPEAYRQKLSRSRKKMADFLEEYCGLSGTGRCSCRRRVNYAIATQRIAPQAMQYRMAHGAYAEMADCVNAMEELDQLSQIFAALPAYKSPEGVTKWMRNLIGSAPFEKLMEKQEEHV